VSFAVSLFLLFAGVGCSSSSSSGPSEDLANIEATVTDGFGDQKNVIVHSSSCASVDADHFTCDVAYETAEGASATAVVKVTCDSSRCVWREQ
jgi:hypothetical protein